MSLIDNRSLCRPAWPKVHCRLLAYPANDTSSDTIYNLRFTMEKDVLTAQQIMKHLLRPT